MNSEDLIRWLLKILDNSSQKCDIYNVGSDEIVSIHDLAKIVSKKNNKKVEYIKKKNNKKKRLNIDFYVPEILKAKKKLDLKLNYNLKRSLAQLLNN